MYPDRHVRSLKRSKLKKKIYRNTGILVIFLLCLMFIGPLIHETTHILWMEYQNCIYDYGLNLGPTGLHGIIKPLCQMSNLNLIIFYSTGYLSTLIFGTALNVSATEMHERTSRYVYPLSAGTGLMLSVVIGLTAKGDLAEIFDILGFDPLYSQMFTAALMVSIFLSNFKSIDIILSELEWEE